MAYLCTFLIKQEHFILNTLWPSFDTLFSLSLSFFFFIRFIIQKLGWSSTISVKRNSLGFPWFNILFSRIKGKIKCTWKTFVEHEFHIWRENNGRSSVKYEITWEGENNELSIEDRHQIKMVKQVISLIPFSRIDPNVVLRGKGGGKWDPRVTEPCGKIHWLEVDEVWGPTKEPMWVCWPYVPLRVKPYPMCAAAGHPTHFPFNAPQHPLF